VLIIPLCGLEGEGVCACPRVSHLPLYIHRMEGLCGAWEQV
jgi:hypothetical protein